MSEQEKKDAENFDALRYWKVSDQLEKKRLSEDDCGRIVARIERDRVVEYMVPANVWEKAVAAAEDAQRLRAAIERHRETVAEDAIDEDRELWEALQ